MRKRLVILLLGFVCNLCCRAQFESVVVGDTITQMTFLSTLIPPDDLLFHTGYLRRGHACIDWTASGALYIPAVVTRRNQGTYPIRAIGFHSFYKCAGLTEVRIPASVGVISYEAFFGCRSLAAVYLPDSLVLMEGHIFSGCPSLRLIHTRAAMPPRCKSDVFDEATYQEACLEVPHGYGEVYRSTEPWSRFETIRETDEEGVKIQPNYDYWELVAKTMDNRNDDELWRLPQRVDSDVSWAASVNTSQGRREITFSTRRDFDMVMVGTGNSDDCCIDKSFTGTITLPDSVTSPDGRRYVVGGIAQGAFSGCRGLSAVTMPEHLKVIEKYAFYDCASLQEVIIPGEVREVLSSVFVGCSSLNRVETLSPTPPDLFVDAFDDHVFNSATLVLPEGTTDSYMATDAWPLFRYHMERFK